MHQNVTIAEAVVLSCFRFDGAAPADRLRGGQLPLGALPLPGASAGARHRRGGRRRGRGRGDRRADAARPDHARPLQDRRDPGRRGDRRARRTSTGAHVVLDAYQSVGTVPLDVTALGVDFAVGGSVKWLCGGPGAGWLYVRPDLAATLEPALTGWQAHARPFDFEPEQDYAEGAARFLTGTPNVPALYAATAGYDMIEEVGIDADPRALASSRRRCWSSCSTRPASRSAARATRRGAAARSSCRSPDFEAGRRASWRSAGSSATAARTSACGSGRTSSTPTTSSASRSSRSSSSRVRARACGRRRPRRGRSASATPSRASRRSALKSVVVEPRLAPPATESSSGSASIFRRRQLVVQLDEHVRARRGRRRTSGSRTRGSGGRGRCSSVSSATSRWSWCRSEPWWVRTRSGETLAFSPSKYSLTSGP